MTELAYRPDQTPLGAPNSQERFVFVDPADRHGREFEIAAQARPAIGADSPEINEALEDAHRLAQQERSDAAARTPEQVATDAELAQAIDWNAQTIKVTRDHAEEYGLAA